MKIKLEELTQRSKYIKGQKHPTLDLMIWNYNNACQFDQAWDEYTMLARGLITDMEGNIVARPFKKFFNLNQTEETKLENILNLGQPRIYEKLDGSLGIQYYDGDIPQIATRGSYASDQARWASDWIESRYKKDDFLEGYTYLYEIIYPNNRIVVDYGERAELVLLAVVNTKTGQEADYISEAKKLDLSYATEIQGSSIQEILELLPQLTANEEGFIVKYNNGLRVKMKGNEYVRMHRLVTQTSSTSIWDMLRNGDSFESLINTVPAEFRKWIKAIRNDLNSKFNNIQYELDRAIEESRQYQTRKDIALMLIEKHPQIKHIVFAYMDSKNYNRLIWDMIKPEYSRPFVSEEEEMEEELFF